MHLCKLLQLWISDLCKLLQMEISDMCKIVYSFLYNMGFHTNSNRGFCIQSAVTGHKTNS